MTRLLSSSLPRNHRAPSQSPEGPGGAGRGGMESASVIQGALELFSDLRRFEDCAEPTSVASLSQVLLKTKGKVGMEQDTKE